MNRQYSLKIGRETDLIITFFVLSRTHLAQKWQISLTASGWVLNLLQRSMQCSAVTFHLCSVHNFHCSSTASIDCVVVNSTISAVSSSASKDASEFWVPQTSLLDPVFGTCGFYKTKISCLLWLLACYDCLLDMIACLIWLRAWYDCLLYMIACLIWLLACLVWLLACMSG